MAGAVRPTLGPAGRTVIIERPMFRGPLATKDGVSVAEEVELFEPFANMGAQMIFESAANTSNLAGDGTTTATVLAHAIYREGTKLVAAGYHPIDLKKGIERATEAVVEALGKMSKPIAGKRDIAKVATISANGEAEVGRLIAEAVGKVGKEGIIHVEQGTGLETKLEVAEGVEIDRGFSSPYFITNKEQLRAELDDPYILLCQDKINSHHELLPILQKVKATGRSLLVIGETIGESMSLLVVNKLEGTMNVCGILPPFYMDARRNSLGDLAAQTGGRIVEQGPGVTLANATLEDLGRAKRVVVSQDKTTIIGGVGRKTDVEVRAREIRRLYEATESTYRHQELNERLRRLVGGAAVIRVGGTTDPETRERKARIEDAMFATRAAIQQGIVVGGGVALVRASQGLRKLEKELPDGQSAGAALLRRACEIPCQQIAQNAGENGALVVARVKEGKESFGYNAATGRYEDLMKAGVIDPTMVVCLALENAASIAALMLSAEVCMVEGPLDPVDYPEKGSSAEGLSVAPYLSRRRG